LKNHKKSEDDSYVDSKAEVVFTILNTFNKKDYEDVTLKPRPEQNRNFEDLIRKCDIIEGESEDL